MLKSKKLFLICLVTGVMLAGCAREEPERQAGKQEWVRVLSDTIFSSTDDELFQGRNGKLLSDNQGNLYLYYYQGITKQSVVMKCDVSGNPVWKKNFPDCEPMDMVIAGDELVLAVRMSPLLPTGIVLYIIQQDGSFDSKTVSVWHGIPEGVNNACLSTLLDNSLIISGSCNHIDFTSDPPLTSGFIVRVATDYSVSWKCALEDVPNLQLDDPVWGQNSIIPLKTNQFLFEYSVTKKSGNDSAVYGLMTGLLDPNGTLTGLHYTPTGYFIQVTGGGAGYADRYCNGLLRNSSGAIYHYSGPEIFRAPGPARPNGFLVLDDNGLVTDTVDIPLPAGYRILSCTPNGGQFLVSAYKKNLVSGTSDYSANQTLFLYGSNWNTATSFSLQGFYSDFFPSAVATSDGGFVLMGKIQSFNESANKLVLVKWKSQ